MAMVRRPTSSSTHPLRSPRSGLVEQTRERAHQASRNADLTTCSARGGGREEVRTEGLEGSVDELDVQATSADEADGRRRVGLTPSRGTTDGRRVDGRISSALSVANPPVSQVLSRGLAAAGDYSVHSVGHEAPSSSLRNSTRRLSGRVAIGTSWQWAPNPVVGIRDTLRPRAVRYPRTAVARLSLSS